MHLLECCRLFLGGAMQLLECCGWLPGSCYAATRVLWVVARALLCSH